MVDQLSNFVTGLVERAELSQSATVHGDQSGYSERQPSERRKTSIKAVSLGYNGWWEL